MLEEFAKLFVKAVAADGILEEDYFEKRRKRYLKEVERGAIKKVHVDETPKDYGRKPKKKRITKAMKEQNALSKALELIENETENEIPQTDRARKSKCA